MQTRRFVKDEMICEEDSSGDEMYMIRSGRAKVYKTIDSEEFHLAFLGAGDFFGEMCLLLKGTRTASVKAVEDSELIVLKLEDLTQKIQQEPDFGLQMITMLARRDGKSGEGTCQALLQISRRW